MRPSARALIALMDFRFFKGKLRGPEDRLALDVAAYLRMQTLNGNLLATWTNIPHEVGATSLKSKGFNVAQTRYAKAKAQGLITGSGDFVFVWPSGGGWIELKAKRGALSGAQKDFMEWCEAHGSNYATCRSVEDVANNLIKWGAMKDHRSAWINPNDL